MHKPQKTEAGQAMVEMVFVLLILALLFFGLLDFGRFIAQRQVLVNVTREGANLAARGITNTNVVNSMTNSAAPMAFSTRGRVILTEVINTNGTYRIASQITRGGLSVPSRIGTGVGATAILPATTVPIPQPQQKLFVAEAFYTFTPSTPVGRFFGGVLPPQVYDVSYFVGL